MADAAWKKLNEKIKAKHTKGRKKDPPKNHGQGDELTNYNFLIYVWVPEVGITADTPNPPWVIPRGV